MMDTTAGYCEEVASRTDGLHVLDATSMSSERIGSDPSHRGFEDELSIQEGLTLVPWGDSCQSGLRRGGQAGGCSILLDSSEFRGCSAWKTMHVARRHMSPGRSYSRRCSLVQLRRFGAHRSLCRPRGHIWKLVCCKH